MNQREIVLAALAPAKGAQHSPVQVQKLLFLVDRKIPELVGGPHFDFHPYHYGPFDSGVYGVLEGLAQEGHVDITWEGRLRLYRLTVTGQRLGDKLLRKLPDKARKYVETLSGFVRELSFSTLLSVIYEKYPEMRANSVFQG